MTESSITLTIQQQEIDYPFPAAGLLIDNPKNLATFRALVELELLLKLESGDVPTRQTVLKYMVNHLGVNMAPKSLATVSSRLEELIDMGLLYRHKEPEGQRSSKKRKRDGSVTYNIRSYLSGEICKKSASLFVENHQGK